MRVRIQAEIEVPSLIYEQWGMGRVTLGYLMNESKVIFESAEQIKKQPETPVVEDNQGYIEDPIL